MDIWQSVEVELLAEDDRMAMNLLIMGLVRYLLVMGLVRYLLVMGLVRYLLVMRLVRYLLINLDALIVSKFFGGREHYDSISER